jgi:hypothetical protein
MRVRGVSETDIKHIQMLVSRTEGLIVFVWFYDDVIGHVNLLVSTCDGRSLQAGESRVFCENLRFCFEETEVPHPKIRTWDFRVTTCYRPRCCG